jgi:hypothetical protein
MLSHTGLTSHTTDTGMSNKANVTPDPDQPMVYQIRITGHLGRTWTDWFEGLAITLQDNGDTLLTGPVVDQAALHGVLKKVRDLGMPLVSVTRVRPGETDAMHA